MPHIEVTAGGLTRYVEAWRYIDDSELYAVETVGKPHIVQSLGLAREQAHKDYEFNKLVGHDSKGDLGFDLLKDQVDFMFGRNEFRLRGRSAFSRKIDSDIDWSKWGAIAGIAAIPIALFIWWYS